MKTFFVIDTETTGFEPNSADAIEVSALKVVEENDSYEIVDEFDIFINPGYPLPPSIVEFNKNNHTGICDELLANSPSPTEAAKKFYDFVGNTNDITVVGHNVDFDIAFVNKLLKNIPDLQNEKNAFAPSKKIDTLKLCRKYIKKNSIIKSHKLSVMASLTPSRFAGDCEKYHTSIFDCRATLDVLDYLKDTYIQPEILAKKVFEEKKASPKPAKFEEIDGSANLTENQKGERNIRQMCHELVGSATSLESLMMLSTMDISAFALPLDEGGRFISRDIRYAVRPDQTADLQDYISEKLSVRGGGCAVIVSIGDTSIDINLLAAKNAKSEIITLQSQTVSKPTYKDEIFEFREALADSAQKLNEYQLKISNDRRAKKENVRNI